MYLGRWSGIRAARRMRGGTGRQGSAAYDWSSRRLYLAPPPLRTSRIQWLRPRRPQQRLSTNGCGPRPPPIPPSFLLLARCFSNTTQLSPSSSAALTYRAFIANPGDIIAMIFGGLEIVAGGYFAHKYYKNKNEKRRLQGEAQARRHNSFPGNKWTTCPSQQPQQQPPQQRTWPQQPISPQQKRPCYASVASVAPQPQPQHRPHPIHTQSFKIPRRPVPQREPAIIIQPSLQRADSMATISRMPIANGWRPADPIIERAPVLPPRQQTTGLSPIAHSPYSNPSFSVSSPAFGATPTSPPIRYVMGTDELGGRHTIDDNWETYDFNAPTNTNYAPTVASTQLGEHDPPPPYVP